MWESRESAPGMSWRRALKERRWQPEAEVEDAQQDGGGVLGGWRECDRLVDWKLSGMAGNPHITNIINFP